MTRHSYKPRTGCAASFVLMMLPPKSGRKAVRLRNAGTIATVAFLYADIISAWIRSEGRVAQEKEKERRGRYLLEWVPGFRDRLIALSGQIQAVKVSTMLAKWEGSIRGKWPSDQYAKLADVQGEMVANLALLGGALSQIDADMRVSFLQHTRVVNPNFIADVMATFSIVSQALKTGEPIPEAFHQNLLDRLHYHGIVGHHSFLAQGDIAPDAIHRQHAEAVTRYEYMFYATAILAVVQLLEGLNELRNITVNLCGEIPLQGYAQWKDEYDRAHLVPKY
ncbi:hypothetical protein EIP86_003747 [Pleurotus ostreatoroseus]|nr:hypothetical protein EIP86_003747 [Pleurotus ostreatoroseus]